MKSSIRKITLKTVVTVIQSCGFFLSCSGRAWRVEFGGAGRVWWEGLRGRKRKLGRFGESGAVSRGRRLV